MRDRRLIWIAGAFAVLLVNTAYLWACAEPSFFYFSNVALHVGLGVILTIVAFTSLIARRPALSLLLRVGLAATGAGIVAGLVLTLTGATAPYRRVRDVHILVATGGTLVLAFGAGARARQSAAPAVRRLAPLYPAAALALVAVAAAGRAVNDREQQHDRIDNPTRVPVSMDDEGRGPRGPFFPSSADTNTGDVIPANFFMTSAACGRCHQDIYAQWSSSAHHFSSFNNQWYRKSIEYMQEIVGTRPSKWCAGCHDHAVFFNGRFDRPIREQIETPEAQAGLACTSCHSIVHVNSSMGQGDFVIEYPPLHDLAASERPLPRRLHDVLLYWDPEPHRRTFLKPFHRDQTAEFCSSCHKVHLDAPVNSYRWIRGFNEYDNWQASGVSGQGARSFYYPAAPQKCTDCHMPLMQSRDPAAKNGMIHSHRFPGANTALPFVNHDAAQLDEVQRFLRDGQISIDVFAVARATAPSPAAAAAVGRDESPVSSTFAVGEESMNFGAVAASGGAAEVIAPLDKVQATVRRGDSVRVEVVVRTRKVGHFFPAGTVDAFDVWVELEAVDDRGRTLFHSGGLERENGPVEPGAHFYRSLQLDAHGNVINKRNAWMTRSLAYVRLIPPGAADTIHYRFDVPPDAGNRIVLRARVNYRKFSWWNTQWAFAGIRDPRDPHPAVSPAFDDGRWLFTGDVSRVSGSVKGIPEIPITVMAQAEASLAVAPRDAKLPDDRPRLDRSVRERWNDYGIGLLLQGDLLGAASAFQKVTETDPGYADGWVNRARAAIQEGNMNAAEPLLRQALAIDGDLAKTHFFLGIVLKSLGRYEEALEHLRAAATKYPRDRVVRNQIGRVLFLQRRFDAAIVELRQVLTIDPEDLAAHYTLMLCYRGTGDLNAAEREESLYKRFKADESAEFITGPFRLRSPDDNNERQSIHEHRSAATAAK
jgi:tetratricopeptide (TPR) repeat protein